ncbi:MAG: PEP-CTERM sorting domain-containing protein [FCB group bacterium]|nr:PEP-CTERM sorting domain-containing protein [FCB group bacterium]
MTIRAVTFIAGVAIAVVMPVAAYAAVLDLATSSDNVSPDTTSGTIGGAIFEWTTAQPTGTGVIDTFVQVQAQGNETFEQGYNTTVNNVFDNGSSDIHNHALLLTDIPIVNISGVDYRQFLLDINESLGQDGELLSLMEIQVLQSDTANPNVTTFSGGVLEIPAHAFVYRLDDGVDNTIELNAALGSGSGSGDMFFYVRDDLFAPDFDYVYLYSEFGRPNGASAGFEEWAVIRGGDQEIIPEPATLSLLGLGLAAMVGRRLRKRA